MRHIAGIFVATMLVLGTAHAQEPDAKADVSVTQDAVLEYLEQLIDWQRKAVAFEPSTQNTRELIFQDTLQGQAIDVLRGGFKFARMEAKAHPGEEATPEEENAEEQSPRARMKQRVLETDAQVAHYKEALAKKGIAPKQREMLEGKLKLALAKQELLQSVVTNMAASSDNSKGFASRINNLARSIPELNTKAAEDAQAKADAAPADKTVKLVTTTQPVSVLSLSGDLFSIARKQRELSAFVKQTETLEDNSRELIKSFRTQLDGITEGNGGEGTIDEKVAAYKELGSIVLPLGEATMRLTATKRVIEDWRNLLEQRFQSVARQFSIYLVVLGITLAIPLVAGEVARRAIEKYTREKKRQQQLHTARRIIVGFAVVIILLLNFISDFSSFATFAGFLTAGLAVALQSVLLSLVAHFFFYGRYGVRTGDRVKVGAVAGDIVQIGIMRFHMRELKRGEDGEFQPTGKVVSFPNSILFQPAAFYKYVD